MSDADMLLRDILERGDITGRDASGRIVIELAVDRPTFERLMVFGAELADAEDGGDEEPWAVAA
jgi:hypothetical protein